MFNRRIALVILIAAGCAEDETALGTAAEEIRGRPYFTSCSYAHESLLYSSLRAGRWLVETPEFLQCMSFGHDAADGSRICDASDTGCTRYISCDEDDRPSVTDALTVASSPNDVEFECTVLPAGIGGQAATNSWGHTDREEMEVNELHLNDALANPSPWAGQVVIANTIWHELMHQHGYEHADDPDDTLDEDRAYCGRGPSWNPLTNSMPHFLDDCLRIAGFFMVEQRVAAAGHVDPWADKLEHLVESGMARHGIHTSGQVDFAIAAAAWKRRWRVQHSGLCLDVADARTDDGAPVNQYTCHAGDNQKWVRLHLTGLRPPGEPTRYVIMNVNSGKCLDRPNGSVANGTQLQQFTCHAGVSQQFILRTSTWQWEAISPTNGMPSGQCLDVPSFAMGSARLQMSPCENPATHDIRHQVINLIN